MVKAPNSLYKSRAITTTDKVSAFVCIHLSMDISSPVPDSG